MRPQSAAPTSGIVGSGKVNGSAAILHFPSPRRECTGCAIPLPPKTPRHHALCGRCFHWRRIGRSVAALVSSLREVRR